MTNLKSAIQNVKPGRGREAALINGVPLADARRNAKLALAECKQKMRELRSAHEANDKASMKASKAVEKAVNALETAADKGKPKAELTVLRDAVKDYKATFKATLVNVKESAKTYKFALKEVDKAIAAVNNIELKWDKIKTRSAA